MKRQTIRRVLGLWALCLVSFPAIGWAGKPIDWAAQPQCLSTWIAAGQRTVTPAEVIGKPREHLTLRGHNPYDIRPYEQSRPDNGYLITDDKVDLVTTCDGFDYVRFHGPKRVSTGWVDEARIKVIGSARGTRPLDAPMLCEAAESTLNSGKQLDSPPTTVLTATLKHILPGDWQGGWDNSSARVAHIAVDGRPLAVLMIDGGLVYVFSDDLKTELSPADRESRDVENDGGDSWAFGVTENVVIVHGHPMVRSWGPGGDSSSSFHLSLIDRDGEIEPTCNAKREPLKTREIVLSTDASVCHAILAGQQVPVPMHVPVPGASLVLGRVPRQYISAKGQGKISTAIKLYYVDKSIDALVEYALISTGRADLNNSDQTYHVGLVSFTEDGLAATYHPYWDSQVLAVYLDKSGVADLSSDANQKLATVLPDGMSGGKLVTLGGATYLELSPDAKGPSSEIWKIHSNAAHKVCSFRLMREVVRPISE